MAAAGKPVAGQSIESQWGAQVHDVTVTARGVCVAGAAFGTAAQNLPLDSILFGDPSMVDLVTNELIAPVDGIYEVLGTFAGIGQASGTGLTYFAHMYGGTGAAYQSISGTAPSAGASVRRWTAGGFIAATAGQRFWWLNSNPGSGGTIQIERLAWRLVAQAFGAS